MNKPELLTDAEIDAAIHGYIEGDEIRVLVRAIEAAVHAKWEALKQEPCGFMWQHEETGRVGFAEESQREKWKKGNPRLSIVGSIYLAPQPAQHGLPFVPWSKEAELRESWAHPAQQEPVATPDNKTWCAYIAGIIGCYLGDDDESPRVRAIAGIIERRMWSRPAPQPAPQTAQQERKDEAIRVAMEALHYCFGATDHEEASRVAAIKLLREVQG